MRAILIPLVILISLGSTVAVNAEVTSISTQQKTTVVGNNVTTSDSKTTIVNNGATSDSKTTIVNNGATVDGKATTVNNGKVSTRSRSYTSGLKPKTR